MESEDSIDDKANNPIDSLFISCRIESLQFHNGWPSSVRHLFTACYIFIRVSPYFKLSRAYSTFSYFDADAVAVACEWLACDVCQHLYTVILIAS